jgi:hypothetical protein
MIKNPFLSGRRFAGANAGKNAKVVKVLKVVKVPKVLKVVKIFKMYPVSNTKG